MDVARLSVQTALYVASTALQLAVGISQRDDDTPWFPAIVVALLVTQMILTVASLIGIYRKMDFQGSVAAEGACVLTHMVQLGTIWRWLKALVTRDPKDFRELHVIYLVLGIIRDAPFVILQVCLMAHRQEITVLDTASVAVAFLFVLCAHTCATVRLRARSNCSNNIVSLSTSLDTTPASHSTILTSKSKVYISLVLKFTSRLLLLISRLLALGLFAAAAKLWVFLIIFIHTIIHILVTAFLSRSRSLGVFTSLSHNSSRKSSDIVSKSCDLTLSSCYVLIEVIDLINSHVDRDALEVVAFYSIIALQNAAMSVLWFAYPGYSTLSVALFATVLTTFVLGTAMYAVWMRLAQCASRTIFKEADSLDCNPASTKTSDTLILRKDRPSKKPFVASLTDVFRDSFDNKAFDRVEQGMSVVSLRSVPPVTGGFVWNDLQHWDIHRGSFQGLAYLDWEGKVVREHLESQNTQDPGTVRQSLTVLCQDSDYCSENKVAQNTCPSESGSRSSKSVDSDSDGAQLENISQSSHDIPDETYRPSAHIEAKAMPLIRIVTGRRSLMKEQQFPSHSRSCMTCVSVEGTVCIHSDSESCSRTFCSHCHGKDFIWNPHHSRISSSSSSSSSSYDDDDDDDDRKSTAWGTLTWPPRRRLAAHNVCRLPQEPLSSDDQVRKWLQGLPQDTLLSAYATKYSYSQSGRKKRTQSLLKRQSKVKIKSLLTRICRAQRGTLHEQLKIRRNTLGGSDVRNMKSNARDAARKARESCV